MTNLFVKFEQAASEEELQQFRQTVIEGGFTAFRHFLDGFRSKLKEYEDDDSAKIAESIALAKRLFPEPAHFSPSWAHIWDEFEAIAGYKRTVLESIGTDCRDGEWQILIDNPYTNADLVCYPSLTFLEGVYMYAYFRADLKQNEFIRLQKIETVLMAFGSEHVKEQEKR
ncbi:hypothetical protein SAMN02799630_00071 [Paenibacillus sp. UNCCL117]|uniref:hypothetical protein n=1 Tax=unclassified Paenibacillus TaxID=185978 RepID=UPI0008809CCE|nr:MULTISPECIES: hypothetical protein [unclassified Paenibacillus]SDC53775.1 hypothetical protein SAMN04488602_102461 [Paenibacillus sp. cl123]SFW11139.1 hypothetical protein SAMN02799630_00071 [Paenibacillus sp. UNCCL117]